MPRGNEPWRNNFDERRMFKMAVMVTIDIPGGTKQQYEQVIGAIFPGGKLAEGILVHLAGPTENGWRVVNVVRSQEQFEEFAREKLVPATQDVGDAPPLMTFFRFTG